MNDLINDYKDEGFTLKEWLVYGVALPVVVIVIAILAA